MSKILGSWSGMRKYLEQEMLAQVLRGKVRYGCTAYTGMDGCCIFEICIDGVPHKRFSWETVNTWFIRSGCTHNTAPVGIGEYWLEFRSLLEKYPMAERTEYTDEEFCAALEEYRSRTVQESAFSQNPLVRMFAVLDRRLGKRTLLKLKGEAAVQPKWLQQLYELRFSA